jgi:hypothetical protein
MLTIDFDWCARLLQHRMQLEEENAWRLTRSLLAYSHVGEFETHQVFPLLCAYRIASTSSADVENLRLRRGSPSKHAVRHHSVNETRATAVTMAAYVRTNASDIVLTFMQCRCVGTR